MMEPRLPLDDRKQFLKQKVESDVLGSNQTWYIFLRKNRIGEPILWLGIRQHDLGGTDYGLIEKVSLEEAEWLLATEFVPAWYGRSQHRRVYEFMDAIKGYKTAKPVQGDYIGA